MVDQLSLFYLFADELRPPLGYPYLVVRVGCTKCPRSGSYRLARLAERYGANIRLTELLNVLSADCKLRGRLKGFVGSDLTCGAIFPNLGKGGPPGGAVASGWRRQEVGYLVGGLVLAFAL